MLMKAKVDFHYVEPEHKSMDDRLCNWALWLQTSKGGYIHPMWAKARSNAWQWHTPEYRPTCDILDAQAMEKAVCALPEKHRKAVQWHYVYKFSPTAMARELGVSLDGLNDLVRVGRQMLINRSKS